MASHSPVEQVTGPFPASKRACNPVRPYFSAAGNALVREGARNLVVILRKSQLAETSPANEAGSFCAPDGHETFSVQQQSWFSVHKPAHADIHDNSQRQKHEEYRRSPVTH